MPKSKWHCPIPLVHIDTSFKIPKMIQHRDELTKKWNLNLVVGQNLGNRLGDRIAPLYAEPGVPEVRNQLIHLLRGVLAPQVEIPKALRTCAVCREVVTIAGPNGQRLVAGIPGLGRRCS